jgi:excisionase family DNA binding protein
MQNRDGQARDLVEDGFATLPQGGKFLALCRASLYALMDKGELPYAKFGKSRRIPWRALHEYARKNLIAS